MSNGRTAETAALLIAEIRAALARGTKHYDQNGKLLETPLAILECLSREGRIDFKPGGN